MKRIIAICCTFLAIAASSHAQIQRHPVTTIPDLSTIEALDVFSMVEKRVFPFRTKMVPEIYGVIELDSICIKQEQGQLYLVMGIWLSPNVGGWFVRPTAYLSINGSEYREFNTSAIPDRIEVAILCEIKVNIAGLVTSGYDATADINFWLTDTDLGHREFTIVIES